ncbi:MAG: polysaccharide deacetylase family protein [Tepidanaerobacteraceae bacterium]|jgi:hypothetical protein
MSNKNERLIFVILLTFFLSGFAFFGCLAQQEEHNCKIAVLMDSQWNYANGWPQTDYISILRETVSALDYLGYMYEVVDEKTSNQQLNRYEMLISVTDMHTDKITQYSESTGRTTLILYSIGPEFCKRLGITLGNFNLKEEDNAHVVIENNLTKGIASEYGSIPIWGAYNHSLGANSQVLMKNSDGLPIMFEQKEPSGRYVFLLTRALTWNACSYRLVDNIIRDSTNMVRIGGTPYAMDVPVIIRLDDFCTWSSNWKDYTDITNKLTVAAIVSEIDTQDVINLKKAGVEIIPHGYEHEDLSQLPYMQQVKTITKTVTEFENITKTKPNGYVAPFNRINDDTTKACAKTQIQWITTYHGMARIPRYHYTDSTNKVWVLGARPEYFTDAASIMRALDEGMKQQKPLFFVEHPDIRKNEGLIKDAIAVLKQTIMFVNANEGYYLTHLGDYFGSLLDQKKITYNGSSLIVEDEVKPGLTFTFPGCSKGNMAKIGNEVLMFYRKGSTVLPPLKKGEYPFILVQKMPVLQEIGPGVVVKNATYNPIQKSAQILLETFADKNVTLPIDDMPRGTYSIEVKQPDGKKISKSFIVSGDGVMDISLQLFQDTETTITITAKN